MSNIQHDFIEFALEANVLRFGEFKTKAGRPVSYTHLTLPTTPYV